MGYIVYIYTYHGLYIATCGLSMGYKAKIVRDAEEQTVISLEFSIFNHAIESCVASIW